VIQEHLEEDVLFGAFFIALSVIQLAWAMAVLVKPTRPVLWAGILVSLGTIAVWVVSRTAGLPFGPEPGEVEALGLGAALATVFETLIVIGSAMLLIRREASGRLRVATATTAIVLMTAIVAAFTAIGLISSVGGTNLVPPAG
jgi:predicted branched-subunit amino acid permease